jgi:hypothetical protein
MPFPGRGGFQTRPYVVGMMKNDDAMDMVRHDDESIETNMSVMGQQIVPTGNDYCADIIGHHLTVNDFTEGAFPLLRAHRHEIGSRLIVIVVLQPDRLPMMA